MEREAHEELVIKQIKEYEPEIIVLAKYMSNTKLQILLKPFLDKC